jgi:heterodisulfide reductase subunit A
VRYVRSALEEHDIGTVRYGPENPPTVSCDDGLAVRVRDLLLGEDLEFELDYLVLVTGFVGDPSVERLKGLLKVSASTDGFFQEAHIKLAPLDFANDGVYVCGTARSPKGVRWSMEEALGAGMRASIPMNRGYVEAPGIISRIDFDNCLWCGRCGNICPFGAIDLEISEEEGKKKKIPSVVEALCKGCGTCAAECPSDGIEIVHYTDRQIEAQIDAALAEDPESKILAFCCHWCAMGAVDLAGVSRAEYPPHVRIIRVMCAGRVDDDWVRKGLDLGAAGVLVAGCEFPTCHYITGNERCQDRIRKLRHKLDKEGYDTGRLRLVWMSAADGPKFVKTMHSMVEELGLS